MIKLICFFFKFWLRRIHDNRYVTEIDRERAAILNGLDIRGLDEMHRLIQEIRSRLEKFKLEDEQGPSRVTLPEKDKNIVLKICIAGT